MSIRNETILSFNWRNLITVAVMVTIGWFLLHLFMAGTGGIISWINGLGVNASLGISPSAADEQVGAQY